MNSLSKISDFNFIYIIFRKFEWTRNQTINKQGRRFLSFFNSGTTSKMWSETFLVIIKQRTTGGLSRIWSPLLVRLMCICRSRFICYKITWIIFLKIAGWAMNKGKNFIRMLKLWKSDIKRKHALTAKNECWAIIVGQFVVPLMTKMTHINTRKMEKGTSLYETSKIL